jgi:hypothetical protein
VGGKLRGLGVIGFILLMFLPKLLDGLFDKPRKKPQQRPVQFQQDDRQAIERMLQDARRQADEARRRIPVEPKPEVEPPEAGPPKPTVVEPAVNQPALNQPPLKQPVQGELSGEEPPSAFP